jgi:GTP-binding protein Era
MYQIIFVDTPGLHQPQNKLGEFMLREIQYSVANCDVVLYILDATNPNDELPKEFIQGKPVILVLNKIDLLFPNQVDEIRERFIAQGRFAKVVAISATNRTHLAKVTQGILEYLPPGEQLYPAEQLMDCDYRLLASELIREQALLQLEDEVPHGIAVEIVDFSESDDQATIQANIIVERESHKGIVIGRGGTMLKTIGTGARLQIQSLMDKKVHLKLWVKVKKNWRKDPNQLKWLGYK